MISLHNRSTICDGFISCFYLLGSEFSGHSSARLLFYIAVVYILRVKTMLTQVDDNADDNFKNVTVESLLLFCFNYIRIDYNVRIDDIYRVVHTRCR